jgi:hypothetical protein
MSSMEKVLADCNKAAEALIYAFGGKTLTERLHDVAEARHHLAVLKESEQQLERIARDNLEFQMWQSAIERRRAFEGEVTLAEQVARETAVADFRETGAEPPAGISIKTYSVLIYDPKQADALARVNAPALLSLDYKTFDRAVKAGTLPGAPAQIVTEARATIASDLSQYLGGTP